ncbi:hypothetical protein MTR_7g103000 [Medicago truncatula]|uniref:Pectinesterase n=1 Tax=Medicago truncatula TaxID=3880 RepID=A0A072U3V4_MEDTR|nr:hypothetical protein MTR_7g103000 [Medicago truncatula]
MGVVGFDPLGEEVIGSNVPIQGDVGAQAVALRVGGAQAAFYGCGIYGLFHKFYMKSKVDRGWRTFVDKSGNTFVVRCNQDYDDLLLIDGWMRSRETVPQEMDHYMRKTLWHEVILRGSVGENERCLIWYEDYPWHGCFINSISNPKLTGDGGYIRAQGQESLTNKNGFSFVNCHITDTGKTFSSPAIKLQLGFPTYRRRHPQGFRRSSRSNKGRTAVLIQMFLDGGCERGSYLVCTLGLERVCILLCFAGRGWYVDLLRVDG